MKKYIAIKKWDDDYNGAGIYSLVDENGKRYIGQAKHIQNRLHAHRVNLNRCAKGLEPSCIENANMINYVRNGGVFTAEILYKIPWYESTENELRKQEGYYCEKYGYKNIYNSAPVPSPIWTYEKMNDIELRIDCDADILEKLDAVGNKQGYIKALIRADIANNG